jgi:hypothetical protein
MMFPKEEEFEGESLGGVKGPRGKCPLRFGNLRSVSFVAAGGRGPWGVCGLREVPRVILPSSTSRSFYAGVEIVPALAHEAVGQLAAKQKFEALLVARTFLTSDS